MCKQRQTVHYLESAEPAVGGILEFMSAEFKVRAVLQTCCGTALTKVHAEQARWHAGKDASKAAAVTCLPLADILAHLGITHIDFFSLDVEGGELGVLQSLDFGRVTFNVLVVESTKREDADAVRGLLAAAGYDLASDRLSNKGPTNNWSVSLKGTFPRPLSQSATVTAAGTSVEAGLARPKLRDSHALDVGRCAAYAVCRGSCSPVASSPRWHRGLPLVGPRL